MDQRAASQGRWNLLRADLLTPKSVDYFEQAQLDLLVAVIEYP